MEVKNDLGTRVSRSEWETRQGWSQEEERRDQVAEARSQAVSVNRRVLCVRIHSKLRPRWGDYLSLWLMSYESHEQGHETNCRSRCAESREGCGQASTGESSLRETSGSASPQIWT